jgi:glutamate carboxypeptidase
LLAAAEAEAPAVVRDLERLVNIDSGTGDAGGLGKVAAFLVARLRELGAKVETTSAAPSVGSSVTGTLRGKGTRDLLLIHFDTVFAPREAARRPFRREGSRAFGPGVADAKGGVAIILHALAIAKRRGIAGYRTLTVLFNPDEEKGSVGSRELIGRLARSQDYVTAALRVRHARVHDPPSVLPASVRRGLVPMPPSCGDPLPAGGGGMQYQPAIR